MITCPSCKLKLEYVDAYSLCRQKASLDNEGQVISYSSSETTDIYETDTFECPNCGEDLTAVVKK